MSAPMFVRRSSAYAQQLRAADNDYLDYMMGHAPSHPPAPRIRPPPLAVAPPSAARVIADKAYMASRDMRTDNAILQLYALKPATTTYAEIEAELRARLVPLVPGTPPPPAYERVYHALSLLPSDNGPITRSRASATSRTLMSDGDM
jgi:hypothetical protein